LKLFAITF